MSFFEKGSLEELDQTTLSSCITRLREIYGVPSDTWWHALNNHELALFIEYSRRGTNTLAFPSTRFVVAVLPEVQRRLCEGVDMVRYVGRLLSGPPSET